MSKKRPTESSWDSDEELLSDTAGISAFPKTSELDLLAEDGELDEEELLGLDDCGAAFSNDPMQPVVNRQRSKTAVSAHQDHGPLADQAFVFEVADTGDLEEELTGHELGNEMLGTYSNEGMGSYSHETYDQNSSNNISHEISTETDQHIYSSNMLSTTEDCKDSHGNGGKFIGVDGQSNQVFSSEQSGLYSVVDPEEHNEDSTNVELGYDHPEQHSDQVHLEYEEGLQPQISTGQIVSDQGEEQAYESDSDSDEDSRHNRGKFKSERTGVISLSATNEREAIPDTLEINEHQAAQIKEFMSDKSQRGRGRGGRNNRGRQSAHNRLGNRSGPGPQPGQGVMFGERMRMINPRFQSPPGPRGPSMPPRGLISPRALFGGMRQQMPPRGPVFGGLFNPMFADARGPQQSGGRFPGGPVGPQRSIPMLGPGALLEPMKQLLQRMRGPQPGTQRMNGPRFLQRPEGLMGIRMPGPGSLRGGHEPRLFAGSSQNRMLRAPQQLLSPNQGGPMLLGPSGIQRSSILPGQLRQPQPNRGRLPPHQRLGQAGAANRVQMPGPRGNMQGLSAPRGQQGRSTMNKRIFVNPLFQGDQDGPTGLTRTVKMGVPVQQKKAKALLEKAKQIQIKQSISPAVAVKRKSTGGDEIAAKSSKKECDEQSIRTVENQEPMDEDSKKISSLLEEQKRKREMIQKRKELARQKLAEEKRKELETKIKTEGNKIESIVGGSSSQDERTVEKSGDAVPIKVVSRSMASRLGPPPSSAQKVQLQNRSPHPQQVRGPPQQPIRRPLSQPIGGPQFQQQIRGAHSQQVRSLQPQQIRSLQPQQLRGLQSQQMRGVQPQQVRGPQSQQMINSQAQLRNNQAQQFKSISQNASNFQSQQTQGIQQRLGGQQHQHLIGSSSQQIRGPSLQQLRGPPPQVVAGSQQQFRGVRPQQRLAQQNQIIGPSQQFRAQPPQQFGGPRVQHQPRDVPLHQTIRGQGPHQLRGPPPQITRPTASLQYNPVQPQASQIRGPPPPSAHIQTQLPPSNIEFQAPPPIAPANSSFITPPNISQHQQQHVGYTTVTPAASIVQGGKAIQPQLVQTQQHHFAIPPPQPPHSSSLYTPAILSGNSELNQSFNYSNPGNPTQPPSTYQQNYQPSQPEYQQPGAQLYTNPYPNSSDTLAHQSGAPTYQFSQTESQAYSGSLYENEQPATVYQNTSQSQQLYQSQEGLPSTSFPQDTNYPPSTDYYTSHQSIQTIQTVTNQTASSMVQNQHHSPKGQKIQTIGQRIQPVTGTQMRSIIHNVASPPQSSTPARSVQQRTPTLHISRAVMEGNVPILPGSQKVIILNVPQMATRETLIRLCRHFGHVEGVNLMRDQNKAVVQFQKGEQAAKCVSKCDQKCLHKTRLTVKLLPS